MQNENLIKKSPLLDFEHDRIKQLVTSREWAKLDPFNKIGGAYQFVKDEIRFGYNQSDDIRASQVLRDGYGQCNTKGTLLIALLRSLGIPSRLHGFTIFQALQKGAIPSVIIKLVPPEILHSWVEVYYDNHWISLEGFILDKTYLTAIQSRFSEHKQYFSGYGIATSCLENPPVEWNGQNTFIQKDGIAQDFGVFNTPDEFYKQYGTNLSGVKRILFQYIIRHIINWNVSRLRGQ
ncbi:MAG: transglutaminase-like putative cysteine protease [Glaciecola sp.]|jgi:transglutaminase-like putative cysteine protease